MKPNETKSNTTRQSVHVRQHGSAKYKKVFDGRKQRIRGLWRRGAAFYAQITAEDSITGKKVVRRVRLEDADKNPVLTVAAAVKAMRSLQVDRERHDTLKLDPKRTPTFSDYADNYIRHFELVKDAKRPAALRVEKVCIQRLKEFIGDTR